MREQHGMQLGEGAARKIRCRRTLSRHGFHEAYLCTGRCELPYAANWRDRDATLDRRANQAVYQEMCEGVLVDGNRKVE